MLSKFHNAVRAILVATAVLAVGGCGAGGPFGFQNPTAPGASQAIQKQFAFWVVGSVGVPFQATVSDVRSSWTVKGTVPMYIAIVNNLPPARMQVTKLSSDTRLLSAEIMHGFTVQQISSTTAPFGTADVGFGGQLGSFAAHANPDIRFFVKAPNIGLFNGQVENTTMGIVVEGRVPALFLFDQPGSGLVDGQFTQVTNFGRLVVDLTVGGTLVNSQGGAPGVRIRN